MLIKGKRVIRDKKVEVINPYNDKVIDTLGLSEKNDVSDVIGIAEQGFKILKQIPAGRRAQILEQASVIIRQRKEDFSRAIALESGKTINEARGEVDRAVNTTKLSALAAMKLTGETVRFDLTGESNKMGFYLRVPLGVVCAITPFNFPLNLSCHKIGPAIAAGNAIIHKPATKTPVSGVMLAEALIEAGLPVEGIAVLVGPGSTIGMALVKHPTVKKISVSVKIPLVLTC